MKNLINKLKLILLLQLTAILLSLSANAQIKCVDPCTTGSSEMFLATPVCVATTDCGEYPTVYVIINYHKYICPGKPIQIVIEDYVLVDERPYLSTNPWGLVNIPDPSDPNYDPNDPNNLECLTQYLTNGNCNPIPSRNAMINNAITELMNSVAPAGNNTWSVDVIFPGTCFSFVTVQVPNQMTHIVFNPNDYGPVPDQILAPNSIINWAIPCNDVCCKTRFKATKIVVENNYTTWEYTAIEYVDRGVTQQDCEKQALPDFQTSKSRPKNIKIYNASGTLVDAPLTVLHQTACELTCGFAPQPPLYKTSGIKNNKDLLLNAKPTLIENSIYLTEVEIIKVAVFDIKGEKVMEVKTLTNGELNTSTLNKGIYFIQVYTSDLNVSTIKVVKQ